MTLLEHLARTFPDSSRTTLRKMLESGRVRVNGVVVKAAATPIASSDLIETTGRSVSRHLPPEITLLHEDESILVVIKPAGLLTVATPHEKERTLQAMLNSYLRNRWRTTQRIHVVHRLDRDTSGVLLFAKTFPAREQLKGDFAAHDIDRTYVALVHGAPEPASGTFRSHLKEDARTYDVRTVDARSGGKLAVTRYRTLQTSPDGRYSLVEVKLETGRKNQIRVHFAEAGHPVVGDERYGPAESPIGRLGLHAKTLGFKHPDTGKKMQFEAAVPPEFTKLFR